MNLCKNGMESSGNTRYAESMESNTHRLPLFLKILLVLVFFLLVIFSVFQFGWFSRAFESEVASTYRSLSNLVQKGGEQEFQKYGALISSMDSVFQSVNTSETDIKTTLERLLQTWGPDGTIPDMISSVAFSRNGNKNFEGLDYTGVWAPLSAISSPELPDSVNQSLSDHQSVVYAAAVEGTAANDHVVLFSQGGENPFLIMVVLNRNSFMETYLKPSIANLLPDYEVTWLDSAKPQFRQEFEGDIVDEKIRPFNPFRGLFGFGQKNDTDLLVVLPLFRGTFRSARGIPSERPQLSADLFRTFLLPTEGDPGGPSRADFPGQTSIFVSVKHHDGLSVAAVIERNYSLYWLGTTGLILFLGALFLLLVLQINRINLLHAQEREFVASISHELRTPLTVIHSAADNIDSGLISAERMGSYGSLILEQTRRLERMVEEVLIFSLTQSGKNKRANLVPFSYQQVIENIKPSLEALASDGALTLVWDTDTLPSRVLGDPENISLIITNLVANAVYHAYPKGTQGQIRIIGKAAGASRVLIIVEDDGRGIPAQEAPLVFLPFYRGKISRECFEKGSGLGLFLTKKKTQILGGKITLTSPYSRPDTYKRPGCRFVVELPRVEDHTNGR